MRMGSRSSWIGILQIDAAVWPLYHAVASVNAELEISCLKGISRLANTYGRESNP